MRTVYACGALALVGLVLLLQSTARTQEKGADGVSLRVVKYDGLGEEVIKHRGKVVVVDFWADY